MPSIVSALRHILLYGAWRHEQAELQQELVGNPLLASRPVVPSHATDERSQVCRDRWPSRLRCLPPEQSEPLAMPADQRHWLDEDQSVAPIEPAGEPGQGHPSRLRGTTWIDLAFLV
jgi:hypothetical protein